MARLLVILVAVAALIAGIYTSSRYRSPDIPAPPVASNDITGSQRPDFRLGSNTGEMVGPADFSGKTLLINFWATWCKPCVKEMPMLVEIQAEHEQAGLQVIGIALDDVQRAREFAEKLGITYPVLVGAADVMATSYAYGNSTGMLPYTVLVDNQGVIRWQFLGEIKRDELAALLEQVL